MARTKNALESHPRGLVQMLVIPVLMHQTVVLKTTSSRIIANQDPEALHDFRVAVRRIRTALTLFSDTLKSGKHKRFARLFSSLGKRTNRMRDLEVILAQKDLIESLAEESLSDLQPFLDTIQQEHDQLRAEFSIWLETPELSDSLELWDFALLHEPETLFRLEYVPVIPEITQRIDFGLEKVARKAKKISGNRQFEKLHELRIEIKRLRYMLEFAQDNLGEMHMKKAIRQLKDLQDEFGRINDLSEFRRMIIEYIDEHKKAGTLEENVYLALSRLIYRFEKIIQEAEESATPLVELIARGFTISLGVVI